MTSPLSTYSAKVPVGFETPLSLTWVLGDDRTPVEIPTPAEILLVRAGVEGSTTITPTVTGNVLTATIPPLEIGENQLTVMAGDVFLSDITLVAALSTYDPVSFDETIVGPAPYPGWGPEGGSGGGGEGPTGPTGPQGVEGPTGPTGPAAEGGSVDWANVPGPITVTHENQGALASIALRNSLNTHPGVKIGADGIVYTSTGAATPVMSARFDHTGLSMSNKPIVMTGQNIQFAASGSAVDTTLARSAAGEMTINGAVIQTAATREDGTEVGIPELLQMIDELKAEVAALRGRKH